MSPTSYQAAPPRVNLYFYFKLTDRECQGCFQTPFSRANHDPRRNQKTKKNLSAVFRKSPEAGALHLRIFTKARSTGSQCLRSKASFNEEGQETGGKARKLMLSRRLSVWRLSEGSVLWRPQPFLLQYALPNCSRGQTILLSGRGKQYRIYQREILQLARNPGSDLQSDSTSPH